MNKTSQADAGQMMKVAADSLRALSEENQELKSELATFRKKDHAEKIAHIMEEKGLETELSLQEKVAGLMKREDLAVVEQAVGYSAPQLKLASVHEDNLVPTEGGSSEEDNGDKAASAFMANLASS